MSLAEELLDAVGGPENVTALTHCWARLRFELRDITAVDDPRVRDASEVVIAMRQNGQYHVALRTGLLQTYDDLTALLHHHQEHHHG